MISRTETYRCRWDLSAWDLVMDSSELRATPSRFSRTTRRYDRRGNRHGTSYCCFEAPI